ncbi:hypothetical protein [Ruminococcus flavefaciens]|uniref:hypothetical protein n=1 Tax=Ruminococcus flavefaciens TaxID=1265 RepID=UPI0026EABC81|nr:hypothetical protein [Ruminococcus flavefaciens]
MATVVTRIKQIKQPYGGYVPLKMFEELKLGGEIIPNNEENINVMIVGLVVDYLTRFNISNDAENSFNISLRGAMAKDHWTKSGDKWIKIARKNLKNVCGLDDDSIINAIKLAEFDDWYRNPRVAQMANEQKSEASLQTIEHIRNLVKRGIDFFAEYGPITKYEFNFNPQNYEDTFEDFLSFLKTKVKGGYTSTVSKGDGDYLTKDTLWDLKVSKNKPTTDHTLQVLMYWIMGQHSGQEIFKNISKIGIFNPRLNTAYQLEVSKIPKETIEAVEKDVICY